MRSAHEVAGGMGDARGSCVTPCRLASLALFFALGSASAAADTLAVTSVTPPAATSADRTVKSSVSFLDLETGALRDTLPTAEIPFVTSFGENFLIAHSMGVTAGGGGTTRIVEYDPAGRRIVAEHSHPRPLAEYFAPGWRTDGVSLVSANDGRVWLLTGRTAKDGTVEHWIEGIAWDTKKVIAQYRVPDSYFRRTLLYAMRDRCLVIQQSDGIRTETRAVLLGDGGLLGTARLGLDLGQTFDALDVSGDLAIGATRQGEIVRILIERNGSRVRVARVGALPASDVEGIHWPRSFQILPAPLPQGGQIVIGLNGAEGIERLRIVGLDGKPGQAVELGRSLYRLVVHGNRCYGIDVASQSLVTYDLDAATMAEVGPASTLLGTAIDFTIGG